MKNDLEGEVWKDLCYIGLGAKKCVEATIRYGFRSGRYLLESASIYPTTVRRSIDANFSGGFYPMVLGATLNSIMLFNSGENWKEGLALTAATNIISGLYELGRFTYNKRADEQRFAEWEKEWTNVEK